MDTIRMDCNDGTFIFHANARRPLKHRDCEMHDALTELEEPTGDESEDEDEEDEEDSSGTHRDAWAQTRR